MIEPYSSHDKTSVTGWEGTVWDKNSRPQSKRGHWNAMGGGTMDIAVKYTGEPRAWFHFQYGVNGTWQHAWGRVGQMPIRSLLASKVKGTLLTGIPVLHPQAVMGSGYAYNCLVAALKAFGRGWGL